MPTLIEEPWTVPPRQPEMEKRLQEQLGVTSLVAALLVGRGWLDPEAAHKFLNPCLDDLGDPSLLPDYEIAKNEILGAKERGELIYIHGDYDVDGVTSASILHRFLQVIGCKVETHVPHRMKEGYGIHTSAVEAAREAGAKLFLTCDCGSSAIEQIKAAREYGMRVVVTDHHTIGHEKPEAHAFINPHREDSQYKWAELSGAGVVFRLCEGLTREVGFPTDKYRRAFLDLAALGTIADVMPLQGENRIIAKFGLERLGDTRKAGLQALKREAKVSGPMRAYHVGFVLGPRLNAAGRIDDAAIALQLLLENDELKAAELAAQIEVINSKRREEQNRVIEEAINLVLEKGLDKKNVILVGHESWHAGIVGIVAGRLVERFGRPAFVGTVGTDGIGKASGRSIDKFNLANALRALPDQFLGGGGHAMAAGCSFEFDKIDRIADALHEHAGQFLSEEDFVSVVRADLEVDPGEVTQTALEQLAQMEPFGCSNPTPVFTARGITITQVKPTKNPEHVRLTLKAGNGPFINGMGFGLGERMEALEPGTVANLLFKPCIDEWNGYRSVKWHVEDFVSTS